MKASNTRPITHLKTHSVELDAATYEELRDPLLLLKLVSQSESEYRKGNWKTADQIEADLDNRFAG